MHWVKNYTNKMVWIDLILPKWERSPVHLPEGLYISENRKQQRNPKPYLASSFQGLVICRHCVAQLHLSESVNIKIAHSLDFSPIVV